MYRLLIGLEQIQTGIEIRSFAPVTFTAAGPTSFHLWSPKRFQAIWQIVNNGKSEEIRLDACYESAEQCPSFIPTMSVIREQAERNCVLAQ